jgi:D-glutamate cyclase
MTCGGDSGPAQKQKKLSRNEEVVRTMTRQHDDEAGSKCFNDRMTTDDLFRTLRDLIQVDVGNRGLARDPVDNLLTACPDDFSNACRSIAEHPNPRVGIVTGFMIPSVEPPTGETDGPLGALFLDRVFAALNIPTVLITDRAAMNALSAGLSEQGSRSILVEVTAKLDPTAVLRETGSLTHLIAIERSGPTRTTGHNRTMRGRDITDLTAPTHLLFEGQREYITVGIGDGGNEIGMGKVPFDTIRKNIPAGDQVACRVATDHLIVGGISNWGAYALAAGVMALKRQAHPGFFDLPTERHMLEHIVANGPLVDGVRGAQLASVDGLDWDEYAQPLRQIKEILASM